MHSTSFSHQVQRLIKFKTGGIMNDHYGKALKNMHAKAKVEKTMHEFKGGDLHSGSKDGPKVTNRKQAVAIALNQARREGK